ncbi:MAG: hypothetical protein WD775_10935 [Burkholderiales bacterium]
MSLKPEDAARLIAQTSSENTVLIGGQAIALWCKQYEIEPRLPVLTEDVDYLGTKAEARRISARLKIPHTLKIATFDDATPNSALLRVELEGRPEPVLIDYLAGIVGVNSKDLERSAVVVEYEGESLRVIHPVLLLKSKISNLYLLENKRTREGLEQARLAIQVVAAYIEHSGMNQRDLLDVVEVLGKFAATTPARFAAKEFGLRCLDAIPKSAFKEGVLPREFHSKRWPQLRAMAE